MFGLLYIGGITGINSDTGTIKNCQSAANVTADSSFANGSYGGGIAGFNYNNITGCSASGQVSGGAGIGGLVGHHASGTIENCYATGKVIDNTINFDGAYHGGLVGQNDGQIIACHASGDVTGYLDTGGLVGHNNSQIVKSYATGTVDGGAFIGGLTGLIDNPGGSISQCYATGTVIGSDSYTGGLVGYIGAGMTVEDSYSLSTVAGDRYVGGIIGYMSGGTINNCYHTGDIGGTFEYNGLVGFSTGGETVTNCFFNSASNNNGIGTAKSLADLQDVDTFTDTGTTGPGTPWDFAGDPNDDTGADDIWSISATVNSGYPHLTDLQP